MLCNHVMQTGETCQLESGHKSKRHTSVTYVCEICGKIRAGAPFRTETVMYYGEVDDVFHFCFLCAKGLI